MFPALPTLLDHLDASPELFDTPPKLVVTLTKDGDWFAYLFHNNRRLLTARHQVFDLCLLALNQQAHAYLLEHPYEITDSVTP